MYNSGKLKMGRNGLLISNAHFHTTLYSPSECVGQKVWAWASTEGWDHLSRSGLSPKDFPLISPQ